MCALGRLALVQGNFKNAEQLLSQATTARETLEVMTGLAELLEAHGSLSLTRGHFSEANEFFQRGLDASYDVWVTGKLKRAQGLLAEKQNDLINARRLMHAALDIFDGLGSLAANDVRRDMERIEAKLP